MAPILKTDPDTPDVQAAAEIIVAGGVVAYPTDTLYGLGASLHCRDALHRIYEIKGRDKAKALLLVINSQSMLSLLTVRVSSTADRLMNAFWPGPLTLVFEASEHVPDLCRSGGKTVAVRWPGSNFVSALLDQVKAPVTATSANLSGGPEPTSAQLVEASIGDRVDLVIDGGPSPGNRPSTVVDVSRQQPIILREGLIGSETLKPYFRS